MNEKRKKAADNEHKKPAYGKRDLIVGQGLYSFVTLTHDFPLHPVGKVKEVAIKVALRCHFVNYLWFDEGKSKENLKPSNRMVCFFE